MEQAEREIWRLRVECVGGPFWTPGDTCVRYIDVRDDVSLYDVHVAVMEAVGFTDEGLFAFFTAPAFRARRTYVPDGLVPDCEDELDRYEDELLRRALPSSPSAAAEAGREAPPQRLYHVQDVSGDPWIFRISREPGAWLPDPETDYPFVRGELNEGADPVQYDAGLADFAEPDDGFEYNEYRDRLRKARKEAEESGLDITTDPSEEDWSGLEEALWDADGEDFLDEGNIAGDAASGHSHDCDCGCDHDDCDHDGCGCDHGDREEFGRGRGHGEFDV